MKGRQSRYVTGGESFAEIARRPAGTVVILSLNTDLEDALQEVSKSSSRPSAVADENASCQPEHLKGRSAGAGRAWPPICLCRYSEGAWGKNLKKVFAWLPRSGRK